MGVGDTAGGGGGGKTQDLLPANFVLGSDLCLLFVRHLLGFRISGFGFRVSEFGVQGVGFGCLRCWSSGFRVYALGFRSRV